MTTLKLTRSAGRMVLVGSMTVLLLLAGCGRGEAPPGATETAVAARVLATLTAEAQVTPIPSAQVETVAQEAFEAWASRHGKPYRDVAVKVEESDSHFARVRVVAWFRPDMETPWEEREAVMQCRRVGEEWQCDQQLAFALTAGEQARQAAAKAQAIATAQAENRPWTNDKDGAVYLYVPAGEFVMGSADSDPVAKGAEKPQHRVFLDGFWIMQTEVTNAMYARCVEVGDCTPPEDWGRKDSSYADHPVVYVDWTQANAYCAWAGGRLPTEAESEKAARGTDGRKYPWGNSAPDCGKAQYGACGETTVPVGSKPAGASPYGVLDMAGNVWEWCQDWYDVDYYASSPQHNPPGPSTGRLRVVRGGAWPFGTAAPAATREGYPAYYRLPDLGFRCVYQSP